MKNKLNNDRKKDNNNLTFLIVLLMLVLVFIFVCPFIYTFINKLSIPKIENIKDESKEESKEEDKIVDEDLLSSLHFPIMRVNKNSEFSYYSKDKFKITDISNDDILINAFLDMHEGNIVDSTTKASCSSLSKEFNAEYIDLRIKNILGKNIKYTLNDFNIPEGLNSSYIGEWKFNSNNYTYTYNGVCDSNNFDVSYYDLTQYIKSEYNDKDIIVYYYVGFAKVTGDSYTIFSDPNMTKELTKGNISNIPLDEVFKNLSDSSKKIYKYTFKNNLCTYNDYCMYKGEWIDEL